MKTILRILLLSFLVMPCAKVSAQSVEKVDAAHWSLALKGGLNYYRTAPYLGGRIDRIGWFPALAVEYSINPIWGFGLEGSFQAYNNNGQSIDALAYTSVNVLNLFIPRRTSGVNLYVDAGAGIGTYRFDPYETGTYSKFNGTPMAMLGLSVEIPLNEAWALDLGSQFRLYNANNFGGLPDGGRFSDGLNASVGIRYKIGANKKPHVRNMSMDEYYPVQAMGDVAANEELADRLNEVEQENDANKQRIEQMEDDLQKIKASQENLKQAQNQMKNNSGTPATAANLTASNIQFCLGQKELTAGHKAILDQVAAMLTNNTSAWKALEISGYTDNTGSEGFNLKLSKIRAQLVASYLTSKGVSADRITSIEGYGIAKPIVSNDTADGRGINRRVEINIIK